MGIIFTIIGLIILGMFVRAIAKDNSVAEKPKDGLSWIAQLIFSLIIGAIVWAAIPKSCTKSRDYDPVDYRKIN